MNIVVDSSSLISLSSSCLIKVLEKFSQENRMNFFISKKVEIESVETPLGIKRFELNAVRISKAIEEKWVEIVEPNSFIEKEARRMENTANNCFFIRKNPITLIHGGEAESLALAKQLNAKAILIDERTTRLLAENPANLRDHMQARIGEKISMDRLMVGKFQQEFSDVLFLRSSELVALAFEKKLLESELSENEKSLEACLYALKYGGCALSFNEIEEFLQHPQAQFGKV